MYDETFQRVLGIVKDESLAKELFKLLTEEVYDNLFLALSKTSPEEEIKVYENRIAQAKSPQHAQTIIDEIAVTVYGDNAQEQIKNQYDQLVTSVETILNESKEIVEKAKQGDPEAQKVIQKAQQNPMFNQMSTSQ